MTVYRIRSKALRNEGHKIESVNPHYIAGRLAEVQERDPAAKVIKIEMPGA